MHTPRLHAAPEIRQAFVEVRSGAQTVQVSQNTVRRLVIKISVGGKQEEHGQTKVRSKQILRLVINSRYVQLVFKALFLSITIKRLGMHYYGLLSFR